MRYLLRIVVIVTSLLFVAMAVCAGEDRGTPGIDRALECAELAPADLAPVARTWPDASHCAGESVTTRLKALPNGTAVACDPAATIGAVWQNDQVVEEAGDRAAARCTDLCRDPDAPGDPARCSTFCRDRVDPSRCDPVLVALAWRLPRTDELETLLLNVNHNQCTHQGCRMDPVLEGPCDAYWAAGLQKADDPEASDRSFADMRGGGVGQDGIHQRHAVRCVADRS